MSRLDVLYQITLNLKETLEQDIHAENREAIIVEINELLEQRSAEIKKITPPYSEKEKDMGQRIVLLNDDIEKSMNHIFDELKREMKQIKKQKESNRSYINPYGKMTSTDGMYVDSKQ